jgi:hypothetical protein
VLALRELQAAVAGALLGGDEIQAAREIAGDGLSPEARLQIYRHHVLTTLTAALEVAYPVICRLVDRRFFAFAADRFIRAHPPAGPCLFEYGASFPDFLAAFPACRGLPYLADVARLEWAMNAAIHAPDVDAMDSMALARVSAGDMARLTFTLDPSVSLITSRWPIHRIWRVHQGDAPSEAVDLDSGGVRLEVRRVDGAVTMRALDAADHALRAALAHGKTLDEAAAAAFAVDAQFDLTAALHELLCERILAGFAVSN